MRGACFLSGEYKNAEEAALIAKKIKLAIATKVGDYIKCSIGIAPNRYLAKIASNMQKVDGLTIIRPNDLPSILHSLKLRDMPGIGTKTHKRLINNGITSMEDLCKQDLKELHIKWGSINGEKIWHLIRGADLPVEAVKNSSIGHSQVLSPDLKEIGNARKVLLSLVLKAAIRLRAKSLYTNSVLLTIDGMQHTIKDRIKMELCCDDKQIVNHVMKSFDALVIQKRIKKLRKVSISLHGLSPSSKQLSFDSLLANRKQEKLSKVIDGLNSRLGEVCVRRGLLSDNNASKEIIAFGYVPKSKNSN